LNLPFFLAKRIREGKQGDFATVVHRIAMASIAIGLAASIVAFLVMRGFRETIKEKVFDFTGHLLITKYTLSNAAEEEPFDLTSEAVTEAVQFPFVEHAQEYSHKSGLIRTEEDVLGVIIKGVGTSFDSLRFQTSLLEGRFLQLPDSGYSREVLLSRQIADKLNVQLHDELTIHFFQNPPRFRRLTVVGIYETNLSDYFDNKVILADIRLIQRLNDWPAAWVGGVEVRINHAHFSWWQVFQFAALSAWEQEWPLTQRIGALFSFDFTREAERLAALQVNEKIDYDLYVETVQERYIPIFEWLGLLNRQVVILLVIILGIVCVNMISVLLILVMERTPMVGVLKAMGAPDRAIRQVFIYNGMHLIVKGLAWGNAVGLGLCWAQHTFGILALNPKDYYMNVVPVAWHWPTVLFLNALIFAVVSVVMLVPATWVLRIQPVKAIKFD
jgi:lipoprotein-releasing system permease protein